MKSIKSNEIKPIKLKKTKAKTKLVCNPTNHWAINPIRQVPDSPAGGGQKRIREEESTIGTLQDPISMGSPARRRKLCGNSPISNPGSMGNWTGNPGYIKKPEDSPKMRRKLNLEPNKTPCMDQNSGIPVPETGTESEEKTSSDNKKDSKSEEKTSSDNIENTTLETKLEEKTSSDNILNCKPEEEKTTSDNILNTTLETKPEEKISSDNNLNGKPEKKKTISDNIQKMKPEELSIVDNYIDVEDLEDKKFEKFYKAPEDNIDLQVEHEGCKTMKTKTKKNQRIPGIRSFLIAMADSEMIIGDQKSNLEEIQVKQAQPLNFLVQTTLNQLGFTSRTTANRDGFSTLGTK